MIKIQRSHKQISYDIIIYMLEKIKSLFMLDIIVSLIIAGIVLFALYQFWKVTMANNQLGLNNQARLNEITAFLNNSIQQQQAQKSAEVQHQPIQEAPKK